MTDEEMSVEELNIQTCALCGGVLKSHVNKDHIFPKAIYKWTEKVLDKSEARKLKSILWSKRNVVKVHYRCNYRKMDAVLDVNQLYVPEEKREVLIHTRNKVMKYYNIYLGIKKRVFEKQNNLCYYCHRRIARKNGIMRRIDDKLPRIESNACVICRRCNNKLINEKNKRT